MNLKTIIIFILSLWLVSCRQKDAPVQTAETVPSDIRSEVFDISDSISIYKVMYDLTARKNEMGVKLHLNDDDFAKVEELVEATLSENDEDNMVIPIQKEKLNGIIDVSVYETLYFYADTLVHGAKKSLLRIEYHLTPLDAFVVAIYDNDSRANYLYATDTPEVETGCLLKKMEKLPKQIQSIRPKNAEVFYFTCKDKGLHLFSFLTRNKSEIYLYKDGESPTLLYSTDQLNFVFDITPLPVFTHDKPVLVVAVGDVESDYTEERIMVFDGNKFVLNKTTRIKSTPHNTSK